MLKATRHGVLKAPQTPGVYQFRDTADNILYIGKAKNLKNRLLSYFANDLLPKTSQMVSLAKTITYIKVQSEFEALLLEANLIKKYKPKYNIALKDDKSPLYIGITDETYPRIVMLRKGEISNFNIKIKNYFGPYLSGYAAKGILRRIRKIFPYSTHEPTGKICIYKQLGLCDPCPSEIENEQDLKTKKELRLKFLQNIRHIRNLLNGKLGRVEKDLEKEIRDHAHKEHFELAEKSKKQLEFFKFLTFKPDFEIDEYLENPNLEEDLRAEELTQLYNLLSNYLVFHTSDLIRLECFDIAHLSGSFPTASMVTFIDGTAEKKLYRHFKVYQKKSNSDVDSMREIITRRLKHIKDWGRPDLIIIDGGKPQLSKVHDLLEKENIPFIGLAKQFETIVTMHPDGSFKEIKATGPSLKLLQRIRDEAHRFARRLHHHQLSKKLLAK